MFVIVYRCCIMSNCIIFINCIIDDAIINDSKPTNNAYKWLNDITKCSKQITTLVHYNH